MKNDPRIEKLLQKMQSQGKYIAAICAATTVLQKLSQSPGTAMEFALKLVEILFGVERMEKVNAGVLARI